MKVSNIRLQRNGDYCELHADVRCQTHWVWGDDPFPLWYRFPAEYEAWLRADNGDPFVAACLVPAMALGEPLQIDAPISARLAGAAPRIQEIYRRWDPKLPTIDLQAPIRDARGTSDHGAAAARGLFFSLGVDSGYSLWKNLYRRPTGDDEVTHLIVAEGFDVYLWESERFGPMLRNVRQVASILGKQVLSVTTNLREFSDRMADWLRLYHGAALVSIPLALGDMFAEVRIAAAQTYERLIPSGAHPLLDPLWATETLSFVHDGLEADRLQKIRGLAQCETLVAALRVCTTGEITSEYNCGRCEKCLRTMIGLHIAGALTKCRTLPHEIDAGRVRGLTVPHATARVYLQQLHDALGETGVDAGLRAALSDCLAAAGGSEPLALIQESSSP